MCVWICVDIYAYIFIPCAPRYIVNYKIIPSFSYIFFWSHKKILRVKSLEQGISNNDIQNRKNGDNIAEVTLLTIMTKKSKQLNFQ